MYFGVQCVVLDANQPKFIMAVDFHMPVKNMSSVCLWILDTRADRAESLPVFSVK